MSTQNEPGHCSLLINHIPIELRAAFKVTTKCKGTTMNKEVIRMIECYVENGNEISFRRGRVKPRFPDPRGGYRGPSKKKKS